MQPAGARWQTLAALAKRSLDLKAGWAELGWARLGTYTPSIGFSPSQPQAARLLWHLTEEERWDRTWKIGKRLHLRPNP